jgi:hypothetical protein
MGDFNIPLSPIVRSSIKNTNKEASELTRCGDACLESQLYGSLRSGGSWSEADMGKNTRPYPKK